MIYIRNRPEFIEESICNLKALMQKKSASDTFYCTSWANNLESCCWKRYFIDMAPTYDFRFWLAIIFWMRFVRRCFCAFYFAFSHDFSLCIMCIFVFGLNLASKLIKALESRFFFGVLFIFFQCLLELSISLFVSDLK